MDFNKLISGNTTEDFMSLLLMGLGSLLAILSVGSLLAAATRRRLRSSNTVALVVVTVLAGGMIGFGNYFRINRSAAPGRQIPGTTVFPPEKSDESNDRELTALASVRFDSDHDHSATGWTQWRGGQRDGRAAGGLRDDWKEHPPAVLWKYAIHNGYSSLAIANGLLYTMESAAAKEEKVLCLDAATGRKMWEYQYAGPDKDFQSYRGPRATPTVFDGRVYTVGAGGEFLCLPARAQSDKVEPLWRHDLITEFKTSMPGWGIACSPLIEGGLVIVQPGGTEGSVAAFDRVDGHRVWRSLADPSGYSSPVAATIAGERQIVCCTGKAAVGLRAQDGGTLWYYPWSTAYDANIATPLVMGDYVFVSSGYGHGCALLHIQGSTKSMKAVPAYVKQNKLMRNHHNTCVEKDGFLYGIDESGILRCIDLRKGEVKWESSDRNKGCLILADDRLVILTEDGTVEVVKATPASYQVTSLLKDLLRQGETPCWVLPALDSGRLYLRDATRIVCLDVSKKKI